MTAERVASLVRLLGRAERRLGRRLDDAAAAHGTTVEELRVLAALGTPAADPGRPMHVVAVMAGLTGPALTPVVDRMLAAGLVDRRVDAADRRRVLISLTPAGRARHRRLERVVAAEGAAVEERVGADEIAQLAALLEHLLTHLGDP